MLNYIRAELYRNFNRAYLWVFTGITAGVAMLVNIALKANHVQHINLGSLFEMSTQMLILPVFLVIVMIDMATAEEQKNLTLKNAAAFGIRRSKIVFSKLIVAIILAFISAIIIFFLFFGSGAVLLGVGNGAESAISGALIRIAASIPLWIATISAGTFLALVFNNNAAFSFVYGGIFLLTNRAVKLLEMFVSHKFAYVYNILITTRLSELSKLKLDENAVTYAVIAGIAYTVLFTVLSLVYIKRKEIK